MIVPKWSFWVEANLCSFFHLFICNATGDPIINMTGSGFNYQYDRVWVPLTGITMPNCYAYPKHEPAFPTSCHNLSLFCVQRVKVRDDCLFCWYWWNCWPSPFKLSFHKTLENSPQKNLHKILHLKLFLTLNWLQSKNWYKILT